MIKKSIILGLTATAVISIGILSACGNVAVTEQKNESEKTVETENADETDAVITEETSFGLKDYEGLYCMTVTEEIEDYEVTYTYGYLLNGDGTGISYGQDEIDFTWNETEIHFADRTESFIMEPGKLTVENMEYTKVEGNFITPNPCDVDVDNVEDGNYFVYIDEGGIEENDGKTTICAEIYTEDTYDIVDINRMAVGDVIYIKGSLLPVNSIEETDSGIININGGVENCGSALRALDESNCYIYAGMDMDVSYTRQGVTSIAVSDNVKFIDNRDPAEEKVYTGSDAIAALKEIVKEYPLTCYDGKIAVENSEIVEINRMYRP